MFNLKNLFITPEKNSPKLAVDEIAELLNISSEKLKEFEKTYQLHSMDIEENNPPENIKENKNVEVEDIINRIVNELAAETYIMEFKRGKVYTIPGFCDTSLKPVSLEEIRRLPKEFQPQLTSKYIKKDIKENNSYTVLMTYNSYIKETNPMKKKYLYGNFRQGLDTSDIDPVLYMMLSMNQNSMENWLPQLYDAICQQKFFQIPNTTLIRVPLALIQLTRLEYKDLNAVTLEIVNRYCRLIFGLEEAKNYFIKTGLYSCKSDFKNAYVHGAKEVRELGEYLLYMQHQSYKLAKSAEIQSYFNGINATNVWVVREFIKDKENVQSLQKGFPIHTEYRVFIDFDSKEVLGITPHLDIDTIKQKFIYTDDSKSEMIDYDGYKDYENILLNRYEEYKDLVCSQIRNIIPLINLDGQWSIDIMQNDEDFYIIDMELAYMSASNECVSRWKLKIPEENWLPKIE